MVTELGTTCADPRIDSWFRQVAEQGPITLDIVAFSFVSLLLSAFLFRNLSNSVDLTAKRVFSPMLFLTFVGFHFVSVLRICPDDIIRVTSAVRNGNLALSP